jgi:hypothetical protein
MVDMESVMSKLRNGLFVGLGTFGSTFVGNAMDGFMPGGDLGTAAGQLAAGAGISVAADEYIEDRSSVPNDVVEYAGYGVQGAAWAEMADAFTSDTTSAGVTEVDVREISRTSRTSNNTANRRQEEISVDV